VRHQDPAVATLTPAEFKEAVDILVEHQGVARLRDRLAQLGAFRSRVGLNTAAAIADRVYRLSGGLRLQVTATYAFSSLWGDMLTARLGEEGDKKLEPLVEQVNACLAANETIVEGKEEELDRALAAYRDAVTEATSPAVARLDMLLEAVPAVAERLRAPAASGEAPPEP
jgi:hypothetical protein